MSFSSASDSSRGCGMRRRCATWFAMYFSAFAAECDETDAAIDEVGSSFVCTQASVRRDQVRSAPFEPAVVK